MYRQSPEDLYQLVPILSDERRHSLCTKVSAPFCQESFLRWPFDLRVLRHTTAGSPMSQQERRASEILSWVWLVALLFHCSLHNFHSQLGWEPAPRKPFWLWIQWRSSRFGCRPSSIPSQIQWRRRDIAMPVMPSIPLFEKKASPHYIGVSLSLFFGKLPTKVPILLHTRKSRN